MIFSSPIIKNPSALHTSFLLFIQLFFVLKALKNSTLRLQESHPLPTPYPFLCFYNVCFLSAHCYFSL